MNTSTSARELFIATLKGGNMFTPYLVRYGWVAAGRHAYEISQGESMSGGTLYGVTLIDADGTHNHDLGGAVHSMEEVEEKLQSIRDIYRKEVKK